jgi:hypothetical protein
MNVNDFVNQHTHIGYCEAIIFPNGDIEYANPGHTYKLINIASESRNELDTMIPTNASPLHWLVEHTQCISLWYEFFIYNTITDDQKNTLKQLFIHEIISDNTYGVYTNEKTVCEMQKKLYTGEITMDEYEAIANMRYQNKIFLKTEG